MDARECFQSHGAFCGVPECTCADNWPAPQESESEASCPHCRIVVRGNPCPIHDREDGESIKEAISRMAKPGTALETPEAGEVEEMRQEIIDRADCEQSLSEWVLSLTAELKEARGLLEEWETYWMVPKPRVTAAPIDGTRKFLTRTKPEEVEEGATRLNLYVYE